MSAPTPPAAPAPRSSKLCAPWASTGDIPEALYARLSPEQWMPVLLQASELLYELAGQHWLGEADPPCESTALVRSRPAEVSSPDWLPFDWGMCGCWYWDSATWAWGRSSYLGAHPRPRAVDLPHREVREVLLVTLASGAVLDPSAYVLRGRTVERIDGGTWSLCESGPTTFDYSYGFAPPEGGVRAAVALAAELASAYLGEKCALPARATQVSRQGVSMTLDTTEFLKARRTGIRSVDLWLASVNPYARPRPARVWSPDLDQAHHS